MQFSKITLSTLLMGLASEAVAIPAPAPQAGTVVASQTVTLTGKKVGGKFVKELAPSTPDSQALQKRGAIIVVAGIAGTAALAKVAQIAIEIGADTIKNLGEWNEAREAFTQATTNEMWNRNPDYAKFPAVACYNKGYRLANPANVDAVASVKFELGLLKTEYGPPALRQRHEANTDNQLRLHVHPGAQPILHRQRRRLHQCEILSKSAVTPHADRTSSPTRTTPIAAASIRPPATSPAAKLEARGG